MRRESGRDAGPVVVVRTTVGAQRRSERRLRTLAAMRRVFLAAEASRSGAAGASAGAVEATPRRQPVVAAAGPSGALLSR